MEMIIVLLTKFASMLSDLCIWFWYVMTVCVVSFGVIVCLALILGILYMTFKYFIFWKWRKK